MAVYCPRCAALSNIRSTLGQSGRIAHCQWCGTTGLARVIDDDPYHRPGPAHAVAGSSEVCDAIVIEHVDAGFEPPRRRPQPAPTVIDWSRPKLLGAALGAIIAVVMLCVPLVAALPQFSAVARLPADVSHLEFQKVRSETVQLHGASTLFVEGEIVNRSGRSTSLPAVRISLKSSDGAEVRSWLVEPSTEGLAAWQSIGFRSALLSPPTAATQVTLSLAAREGNTIGLR